MKHTPISRRDFLKNLGIAGAGTLLAASPWLSAFSEVTNTSNEKCRLAIIGPGSRGRFLMGFLAKNPKVEIVALCDIYKPSIESALELVPNAKVYGDYREVLEDKSIDAILVATPLSSHCKIVLDAFDAGKHVFCEKSIGFTMEECYRMYQKHRSTGKIFFTGQQRLFDPRYIKAMEMIHAGTFGEINAIRTFWNRNGDWRRSVPSPNLERLINWRLYKEFSKGLMTELACHQLQIGSWALRKIPEKVMGHGAITYWKDGRDVYDNVSCVYVFDDGVKMTFDSVISNKFYGLGFLAKNPKVEIVALCDIYKPSIESALELVPNAKVYGDYREVLEDKSIDAILVATPLSSHCKIVLDAFDAGKHVFCEKSIGFTMEECYRMYQKHRSTGKIFFTGQQRLFDPRYIKAMEMIHAGTFGEINAIRTFWNRNGDWRRSVPSPNLERLINWRLYKEFSKGLMTELACHQLQIGSWALRKIPEKVMGHGAITYWKDGRDVYDNVSCVYVFDDGVKMTFDSVISNKFYGLEEQIMGNLGTVEPEKGKYYFENVAPAPAFLQMVNDWENKVFDSLPFAGTSWAPETANENTGEFIIGERPKSDGTSLLLEAFVEAVITQKQPERIAEEGYYASMLCLLGHQALEEERMLYFPDEYKIDYLNHQSVKTPEAV